MILSVCPNPSVDTYWYLEGLYPGKTHRIREERRFPGGKGVHVALAVAELGEPSGLLGLWAGDTGDWLREKCGKGNVACHGPVIAGMNRTCLNLQTDDKNWHDTEFLGLGPTLSHADYQLFLREYTVLLDKAAIVVLSGSWPPGAPEDPYGPLLDLAREKGIPAWLDCSGETLRQALPHRPFGLHLNKKEALDGLPGDYAGAPGSYYLQFAQMLALTAGKEGLFLSDQSTTLHASHRLERIVSAVGSGDCLTAGLAVAQYRGLDLEQMARWGASCGSANCLREELGMLYRKDAEELVEKIVISAA